MKLHDLHTEHKELINVFSLILRNTLFQLNCLYRLTFCSKFIMNYQLVRIWKAVLTI
jgi:hypothetical protein